MPNEETRLAFLSQLHGGCGEVVKGSIPSSHPNQLIT